MNASFLKNMKDIILHSKRITLVLVLFALILLLGRPLHSDYSPVNLKDPGSPFEFNFSLKDANNSKILWNAMDAHAGDYYRLSFTAFDSGALTKGVEDRVMVSLLDEDGAKQVIFNDFISPGQNKNFEQIFQTSGSYRNLQFLTQLAVPDNQIRIKNNTLTRLSITSLKEGESLAKTAFGSDSAQFSTGEYISPTLAEKVFDLTKKDQEYGQVFKAQSNNLTAAEFNILIKGSGGVGNYSLYVREVSFKDGNYVVSPHSLVALYFNANQMRNSFADPLREKYFRFPVIASLQKDHYYFVGIKNTAATNDLNHLQFLGSKKSDVYTDGRAQLLGSDTQGLVLGTNNFQIFSTNYPKTVSPNIFIQDVGSGMSEYYYNSSNYFSWADILSESPKERIYKISGGANFVSGHLILDAENSGMEVDFSLDGKNWEIVPEINNFYQLNLSNNSEIYIKLNKTKLKGTWASFVLSGEMETK